MSELIQNKNSNLSELVSFSRRLINGENGKMLIEEHKACIDRISPAETMQVFDALLEEGFSVETVKSFAGKLVNVFFKSLDKIEFKAPDQKHFLHFLMSENREVENLMSDIKTLVKQIGKSTGLTEEQRIGLLKLVKKVKEYELHYQKKENILFPHIENTFKEYRCLQLMWSFHDDFRKSVQVLHNILSVEITDVKSLHAELGKLFFVVYPIIFREEKIVFPVALRAIPEKSWKEMLTQSTEIGWCFSVNPHIDFKEIKNTNEISGKINLGAGYLSVEQLKLLFANLPVDITMIDEKDEVCFFSEGKERIFPRSVAIIGRKVQNCHPPESVHVVNEIVEAFKNGTKDIAEFWIQMGERFIHIRYFAVRNENHKYKGTIEVSQDVTGIRKLKGEKRLLDWKE